MKGLPDTVADLFSPTVAAFFCSLQHRWEDGFTAPLALSGCGARAVRRFFELRGNKRFADGGDRLRERLDLVKGEGLVAFIGPSGAGKTMAALKLASAMAEQGWRPWHVDMRNADPARLYESIERRVARPSVFVLDDCHLAPGQTEILLNRLRTSDLANRALFILTVTTTAIADDNSVDDGGISLFIEDNIEPRQKIIIRPKADTYRRIIAAARPKLANIPATTVKHLLAVTAGDLFLLDEALRATGDAVTDSAIALDAITVETLREEVMQRYFGEKHPSAPTIRRLAAVAQFDVPVPKRAIEAPPDKLQNKMLVSIGPPPAWLFAHAALAELIYSALSIAENEVDPNKFTVDAILAHGLEKLASDQWLEPLTQILRARLKLVDDRQLKRCLLCDERFVGALHRADQDIPLLTVSVACFRTTDCSDPSPYLDLLFNRIKNLLSGATDIPKRDAQVLGMALVTLRRVGAERFEAVFEASDPAVFVRRLGECAHLRAAISGLDAILGYVTPDFADFLIAALDPDTLDALINRTIADHRSVRTIGVALRELGDRDEDKLRAFEAKLGAERMARLIHECADLPATMKMLEHVTPAFAVRLIAALNPDTLDTLVARTIAKDRSVGTIGLALRELGDRDEDQRQLAAFEVKLGAERMARLIRERADLPATQRILQYVTPAFADRLIAALDQNTLDTLVNNTIASAQNIRHLPRHRRFFAFFESRLSHDTWWRLILGCGDLGALSSILVALGPKPRAALLAALCEAKSADWAIMLGRSDAAGFSIFCSDAEPLLSSTARVIFEDVAVAGVNGVVARSTWKELAIAHMRISDLKGASRAKTAFLKELKARAAPIVLASPPAFDDLEDAADFIQILWQERPKDRNTLPT